MAAFTGLCADPLMIEGFGASYGLDVDLDTWQVKGLHCVT